MNEVLNRIVKGRTPINIPLTNISVAYLQSKESGSVSFFPQVPVDLSTGTYYIFNKEDLLRDDVQRKPILGKVNPTIVSSDTDTYKCFPEQIILGYDEIIQSDYMRLGAKGMLNIRQSKSKIIADKMFIHRNKLFAQGYFKSGVWGTDLVGGTDFAQFDNANATPINTILETVTAMKRSTGRKPNKLGMGQRVFDALIQNPDIMNRVIYGGSTLNPATITEKTLAQILGVEEVVIFDTIWNNARLGEKENTEFICDENSMLLVYATSHPAIDEASAGYTFTWTMGQNTTLPIIEWDGEEGTYSHYIGGMMSIDTKIVCKDLGVFFKNAVAPRA
ncbi:MAG: hypothetical protein Q4G33_04570 [bacterium]|nr:hypothetical protein [bacterium]